MEKGQEPRIPVRVEIESASNEPKKKRGEAETMSAHMLRLINFLSPRGVPDALVTEIKEVLKQAEAKSVSPDLVWLAIFLNSKGSSWAAEEKAREIRFLTWSFSLTREDEERLIQLRDEIIEDLLPLIEPDELTRPLDQLTKAVQKVNTMGLQSRWHVEPAEANWKLVAGTRVITRGRWTSPLGYGRGVLKIGNEKCTVRHAFDDRYAEELVEREDFVTALRKCFYAAIVSALEDGTFLRLRRCQECQRFFIAGRLGKKYCSNECMMAADNKRATQVRVPNLRERERARNKKKIKQAAKRRAFRHL